MFNKVFNTFRLPAICQIFLDYIVKELFFRFSLSGFWSFLSEFTRTFRRISRTMKICWKCNFLNSQNYQKLLSQFARQGVEVSTYAFHQCKNKICIFEHFLRIFWIHFQVLPRKYAIYAIYYCLLLFIVCLFFSYTYQMKIWLTESHQKIDQIRVVLQVVYFI